MTPSTLTAIADGVFVDHAPVSILGMPLTSTMTALRLADGGLVIHSPIVMSEARRAAIAALGPVRHLYAPNLYHHLRLGEWLAAFPGAKVHAPAGLRRKRPDLRIDRAHDGDDPEPDFAGVVDELHVDGFRLEETALYHRPSRTLVVADLIHNIGRPPHLWTRIYSGLMGFYGEVAISRMIRWAAFPDRGAARRSVDQALALPLDRIVVGHGAPVIDRPREALAAACAWLPPA
ncbi:MAG: hypothetical protein R3B09_22765 [Nannocystaceae bacterium]